jgi:hypothetical protein
MSGIGTRHKRHEDEMIRANRTRAAVLWWSPSTGLILSVTMFAVGALSSGGAAAAGQKTFASPEAAADALAAAWRSGSKRELLVIFGPEGERLVSSGDPVAEKQARERLASSYAEEHRLETEGARKVVIILSKDEWPYPIPLVRQGTGWRFDLKSCSLRARWRLMGSAGCKAAWLKPHWPLLVWPCDGIRAVLCSLPRVMLHLGAGRLCCVFVIFGLRRGGAKIPEIRKHCCARWLRS